MMRARIKRALSRLLALVMVITSLNLSGWDTLLANAAPGSGTQDITINTWIHDLKEPAERAEVRSIKVEYIENSVSTDTIGETTDGNSLTVSVDMSKLDDADHGKRIRVTIDLAETSLLNSVYGGTNYTYTKTYKTEFDYDRFDQILGASDYVLNVYFQKGKDALATTPIEYVKPHTGLYSGMNINLDNTKNIYEDEAIKVFQWAERSGELSGSCGYLEDVPLTAEIAAEYGAHFYIDYVGNESTTDEGGNFTLNPATGDVTCLGYGSAEIWCEMDGIETKFLVKCDPPYEIHDYVDEESGDSEICILLDGAVSQDFDASLTSALADYDAGIEEGSLISREDSYKYCSLTWPNNGNGLSKESVQKLISRGFEEVFMDFNNDEIHISSSGSIKGINATAFKPTYSLNEDTNVSTLLNNISYSELTVGGDLLPLTSYETQDSPSSAFGFTYNTASDENQYNFLYLYEYLSDRRQFKLLSPVGGVEIYYPAYGVRDASVNQHFSDITHAGTYVMTKDVLPSELVYNANLSGNIYPIVPDNSKVVSITEWDDTYRRYFTNWDNRVHSFPENIKLSDFLDTYIGVGAYFYASDISGNACINGLEIVMYDESNNTYPTYSVIVSQPIVEGLNRVNVPLSSYYFEGYVYDLPVADVRISFSATDANTSLFVEKDQEWGFFSYSTDRKNTDAAISEWDNVYTEETTIYFLTPYDDVVIKAYSDWDDQVEAENVIVCSEKKSYGYDVTLKCDTDITEFRIAASRVVDGEREVLHRFNMKYRWYQEGSLALADDASFDYWTGAIKDNEDILFVNKYSLKNNNAMAFTFFQFDNELNPVLLPVIKGGVNGTALIDGLAITYRASEGATAIPVTNISVNQNADDQELQLRVSTYVTGNGDKTEDITLFKFMEYGIYTITYGGKSLDVYVVEPTEGFFDSKGKVQGEDVYYVFEGEETYTFKPYDFFVDGEYSVFIMANGLSYGADGNEDNYFFRVKQNGVDVTAKVKYLSVSEMTGKEFDNNWWECVWKLPTHTVEEDGSSAYVYYDDQYKFTGELTFELQKFAHRDFSVAFRYKDANGFGNVKVINFSENAESSTTGRRVSPLEDSAPKGYEGFIISKEEYLANDIDWWVHDELAYAGGTSIKDVLDKLTAGIKSGKAKNKGYIQILMAYDEGDEEGYANAYAEQYISTDVDGLADIKGILLGGSSQGYGCYLEIPEGMREPEAVMTVDGEPLKYTNDAGELVDVYSDMWQDDNNERKFALKWAKSADSDEVIYISEATWQEEDNYFYVLKGNPDTGFEFDDNTIYYNEKWSEDGAPGVRAIKYKNKYYILENWLNVKVNFPKLHVDATNEILLRGCFEAVSDPEKEANVFINLSTDSDTVSKINAETYYYDSNTNKFYVQTNSETPVVIDENNIITKTGSFTHWALGSLDYTYSLQIGKLEVKANTDAMSAESMIADVNVDLEVDSLLNQLTKDGGLLSTEEKAQVEGGKNITVELGVKDISEEEAGANIKAAADGIECEEVIYLDIDLTYQVGYDEASGKAITETEKPVEISLTVPDGTLDADYRILREHDGVVTVITPERVISNPDGEGVIVVFKTNQFSKYSLLSGVEGVRQAELTIDSLGTVVYGDADITLGTTGGSGDGAVTFSAPVNNGVVAVNGSTLSIIGAGTVEITAVKAASGDYLPARATYTLTVSPKTLTPSVTGTATKDYDASTSVEAGQLSVVLADIVGSDDVAATADYEYESENAGTGITINVTNITLTGAKADSYVLSATSLTTTGDIEKIEQTGFAITPITDMKYKDTVQLSAIGGNGDGAVTFSVPDGNTVAAITGGTSLEAIGAGTVVVTAKKAASTNYKETTATYTLEVAKKSVTPGVTGNDEKVYDGTKDVSDNNTLAISLDGVETGDDVTATATGYEYVTVNAGDNLDVKATGIVLAGADANNYVLSTTEAVGNVGKITKAEQAPLVIDPVTGKKYGDPIFELNVTGGTTGNIMQYSVGDSRVLILGGNRMKINEAGTVTVTVKMPGNDNYNDVTASIDITIDKADPTITLGNLNQTNNAVSAVTAALNPASEDATVTIEYYVVKTPAVPAVPAKPCKYADGHLEGCEYNDVSGNSSCTCGKAGHQDHDSDCGYAAEVPEVPAVYEWAKTVPTAVGEYNVRAYLEAKNAGINLNAAGTEDAPAVTGTLKITQYVAPSQPGDSGNNNTTPAEETPAPETPAQTPKPEAPVVQPAEPVITPVEPTPVEEQPAIEETRPAEVPEEQPADTEPSTPEVKTEPDVIVETKLEGDSEEAWASLTETILESMVNEEGEAVKAEVKVEMGTITEVPVALFTEIKGKNVDVVFEMDNGISWTVNGTDIGDVDFSAINLEVKLDKGDIPEAKVEAIAEGKEVVNLSLTHDGEFGFKATLSVDMGTKNAGMFANLYYYNPETGEYEFICSAPIDEDGKADLGFGHASDYTIVIDTVAATVTNNAVVNTAVAATSTGFNWPLVLIGFGVLLLAIIVVIVLKSRKSVEQ